MGFFGAYILGNPLFLNEFRCKSAFLLLLEHIQPSNPPHTGPTCEAQKKKGDGFYHLPFWQD